MKSSSRFPTLRSLFGACAALCLAVACAGASSPPTDPPTGEPNPPMGGQICTEIGCANGFRVTLDKAQWEPGSYSFHIEADGNVTDCTGALPLEPCDSSPSLSCTGAKGFFIGESGCAMAPDQHGFSEIQFEGAPKQVTISISRDGTELIEQSFEPTYTESQPNGPGCEPTCRQASAELTLGSPEETAQP